jgi:hypothetical protein
MPNSEFKYYESSVLENYYIYVAATIFINRVKIYINNTPQKINCLFCFMELIALQL